VEPPRSRRWLDTFRALRHPNYRLYFIGQLISLLGTWMQSTAMSWLVWKLTEQSIWPGLIMGAQMLPTCLLGGVGGRLAGRWPPRRIIFYSQAILLVLAFVLAFLVLAGDVKNPAARLVQPWHLLLIALANGVVGAVDFPARLTFVIDMVGRDDLLNAIALNSMVFNMARVVGPALGGLAFQTIGPGLCFLINGLSYFAVLAALAWMDPTRMRVRASQAGNPTLLEGFRFVAVQPGLRLLLIIVGSLSLLGWPVLPLLPALAEKTLRCDEAGYASLVSALGVGALAAALVVAAFGRPGRGRLFLGTGMMLAALAEVGLSFAKTLPQAQVGCMILGSGLVLVFSTAQGLVQLSASDRNRGVIMGIWSMVMFGAPPLGNYLSGTSADHQGVPPTLLAMGFLVGLVGVCTIPWLPRPTRGHMVEA
jgi:MFS family permease